MKLKTHTGGKSDPKNRFLTSELSYDVTMTSYLLVFMPKSPKKSPIELINTAGARRRSIISFVTYKKVHDVIFE